MDFQYMFSLSLLADGPDSAAAAGVRPIILPLPLSLILPLMWFGKEIRPPIRVLFGGYPPACLDGRTDGRESRISLMQSDVDHPFTLK